MRFIAAYSQFVSVAGVPARHLRLYLLMNCGHLFEDIRCPQALVRVDLAFVDADQADLCDLDPSPQADGRHATVYRKHPKLATNPSMLARLCQLIHLLVYRRVWAATEPPLCLGP